jgi:hypothetical protein
MRGGKIQSIAFAPSFNIDVMPAKPAKPVKLAKPEPRPTQSSSGKKLAFIIKKLMAASAANSPNSPSSSNASKASTAKKSKSQTLTVPQAPQTPQKPQTPLKQPKDFKANVELSQISHILYHTEDLDLIKRYANNPPKHITYEILLNEIGIYQDKKIKSANIFDATPEEQIELRKEWWKIWIKIINGFKSYGTNRKPLSLKHIEVARRKPTSHRKYANHSDHMRKPLHMTAGVGSHSRSANLSSQLTGISSNMLEQIRLYDEFTAAVANARQEPPITNAERLHFDHIKRSVLSKADNKTKDINGHTDYEYEEYYFNSADTKALDAVVKAHRIKEELERKIKENGKDMKDIIRANSIQYPDPYGFTSLYKPNDQLSLQGMQLPHQFNRELLLKTMIYLIRGEKVYNFVDLQDCSGGTNKCNKRMSSGIGCNPYDRDAERLMWKNTVTNLLTRKQLDNSTYYSIEYEDMTAGKPGSWDIIADIGDISQPSNNTVVHCLAGAGRTGSVLLFLLMRDFHRVLPFDAQLAYDTELKTNLALPYLGYKNIKELIKILELFFINNDDVNVDYVIEELFNVQSQAMASLLRQRINRIFFFLAKHFNVNEFYTYARPLKPVVVLPDDEFSNPVKRDIDKTLSKYHTATEVKNVVLSWLN